MRGPILAAGAAVAALLLLRRNAAAEPVDAGSGGTGGDPFKLTRYRAGTPEQIALFEAAADVAGCPRAWASDPDLHYIIKKESLDGFVGIPNYLWAKWLGTTAKTMWATPTLWPKVWELSRSGQAKPSVTGINSHACGLGQLQPSNMAAYQPGGIQGVGDPMNEAVGMLRYIKARHGTPANARAFHVKKNWY